MIIEICCGSYEDVLVAYRAGAKRVELNSALFLGGLTPTLGSLQLAKQHTDCSIISMNRPRGGGFCYSDEEWEVMMEDCRLLLEHGSDGIAFGVLHHDGTIDEKRCLEMVKCIHRYGKEAVFHRAFDCCNDGFKALETLIDCGVDRILTSGLESDAIKGKDTLKELIRVSNHRIEILPGCGINSNNAVELIQYTQATQLHSSCKRFKFDTTTKTDKVSYAYRDDLGLEVVSEKLVLELISCFK